MSRLQNYLTVDPRKLKAKGVASVRSRVCNLTDFLPELTVGSMLEALQTAFGETYGPYTVWEPTTDERAQIDAYEEKHRSWEWRLGMTPGFDVELDTRFPWGGVQLLLTLQEGRISKVQVFSDTLDLTMPILLESLLNGARYGSQPMAEALRYAENDQIRDIAQWILAENL